MNKIDQEIYYVTRAAIRIFPKIPKRSIYRSLFYELLDQEDHMKAARFLRLKNRLMTSPNLKDYWGKA